MLFEARYLQKLLSGEQPQGDQLRQECKQSAKALMADAGTRAECRAFLGMVEGQVKAVRIQLRSLKRRKKR